MSSGKGRGWLVGLVVTSGMLGSAVAQADTANFELNSKIYTKLMYKNDDSQGCLSMSNPFWPDNIGGNNGACTEFELNIIGRVSKYISAGARLQSRWGALWQDWWENGDVRWDYPTGTPFQENTSGESLGMNHAQYIKLRGTWIRLAPPIPTVKWVHVGASDFGMFNEWTIGKSRYIDRDNGMGFFVEGEALAGGLLSYHTAAIALPKLYVGPRWNTGIRGSDPLARLWGTDWAYALKLGSRPMADLQLTAIGSFIQDWEASRQDPDLTGLPDELRGSDHAVDLDTRFRAYNSTLEAIYTPSMLDFLSVRGLLAWSWNEPNTEYATNAVEGDQGFSPLVYKFDEQGLSAPAEGYAGKLLVEVFDPLGIGLNFKGEYFNIGEDYNAIFGSRREADVLLTDGIITSGWTSGGQLPTLNLANEFIDFDEPWYETIIGWHGATGLVEYTSGRVRADLEGTFITYNTNMQGRNVDTEYPDFLYTDGFTDTYAYTADTDYANVYDRGRDPRSVYKEDQDRRTYIAVARGEVLVPGVEGLSFRLKGKYVRDEDGRRTGKNVVPGASSNGDDYEGDMYLVWGQAVFQVTNELKASLGYEWQQWVELARSGTPERGYFDYDTVKHTGRLGLSYTFGGATANYMMEYFRKDLERDTPASYDQRWNVWRSKATLEVGW